MRKTSSCRVLSGGAAGVFGVRPLAPSLLVRSGLASALFKPPLLKPVLLKPVLLKRVLLKQALLISVLLMATPLAPGLFVSHALAAEPMRIEVPDDFPRFVVPGHQEPLDSLRRLFWLHYQPPAGPLATLWDEWMPSATLWPATTTADRSDALRHAWRKALSNRIIEPEGYVATHQHPSIAHQHGWPFPFWGDVGSWGHHFSLQGVAPGWHGTAEQNQDRWELYGGKDLGIADNAWNVELTDADAGVRIRPVTTILPHRAPFLQLRWRAEGLERAQPYVEWATAEHPAFSPERRFYFAPVGKNVFFTMVPVFRSPEWKGQITRLGINFGNAGPAKVGIQALFTNYDTRHSVNNPNFLLGCNKYFRWTRDLNFLRDNLGRMRLALDYAMHDMGGLRHKCIVVPFTGHDGRPGFTRNADGTKTIHAGNSIGHNYWDILPCGRRDTLSTLYYHEALRRMAQLEADIADHPEWNLPTGPLRVDPDALFRHADEVKAYVNEHFWNESTQRFTLGIDDDGKMWDYGYTFVNCEAIYYGVATPEHAEAILSWLDGERTVDGDTSQGADIYRWRFAARASTKRNLDWYFWGWQSPESLQFGDQVQDGGAVLGFAYHEMMARLAVRGPDDAWRRLREIAAWFSEVQAEGGYRAYYADGKRGTTMQGGGTAGGLGIDREFFESILVPQVVFDGFLGFEPRADGFAVNPRLPSDWPELTVTRIRLHELVMSIAATADGTIRIFAEGGHSWPLRIYLPAGKYRASYADAAGKPIGQAVTVEVSADGGMPVQLGGERNLMLKRIEN